MIDSFETVLLLLYSWLKAGHLIFVIFWVAGLFMLPRFYVYHQESAPGSVELLSMKPSDYFRRQIYACFWFELPLLPGVIDALGDDNLLFETDYPHPTCLYPDPLGRVGDELQGRIGGLCRRLLDDRSRRRT